MAQSTLHAYDCILIWNGRCWICNSCNRPYRPRDFSKVDPSKPPNRNCPARMTPEAKAEREAEQAKQQAEAVEAAKAFAEITNEPSIIEKTGHYAVALLRWAAAGRPGRTDEEVAAIFAICEPCEQWNADKAACKICGCNVSLKGWAIRNKARMATEHCDATPSKW
jgi:hypothetical protein